MPTATVYVTADGLATETAGWSGHDAVLNAGYGVGGMRWATFNVPWIPPEGATLVSALFRVYCEAAPTPAETLIIYRGYTALGWDEDLYNWMGWTGDSVEGSWDVPGWAEFNAISLIGNLMTGVYGSGLDLADYGACIGASPLTPAVWDMRFTSREGGAGLGRVPYFIIEYEGGGGGGDEEDPVAEVLAPEDAAEVAGPMVVRASATDNVGVDHVECTIDGTSIGTLGGPNSGADYQWIVDTGDWVNGSHTIAVTAWDAAGNSGTDSVTVTVSNSMAEATVVLYTEQMSAELYPETWRGEGNVDLAIESVDIDAAELPTSPGRRYNLQIGCAVPGTAADFDAMQVITPNRSHGFAGVGATARWGLKASPQEVLTSWLSGALNLIRLRVLSEGIIGLTTSPASVVQLTESALGELADLSGYAAAPTDMAVWQGKVVVACGADLVLVDPDAGEETFWLQPPAGAVGFDRVEAFGGRLIMATEQDDASGMIWALDTDLDLVELGAVERVTALADCGGLLGIGCLGGQIYSSSGAAPTELYDTAQASVTRIALCDGIVMAGTGTAGQAYRSQPTWGSEIAFGGMTEARAFASLLGAI
jgi:hypothetical protein